MSIEEKKKELQFNTRNFWKREKVILKYMLKEPFIEIRRLAVGYYDSTLLFWLVVFVFFLMVYKNVGGYILRITLFLVIFSYYYKFRVEGKWKEYYKIEYIEGKELK